MYGTVININISGVNGLMVLGLKLI